MSNKRSPMAQRMSLTARRRQSGRATQRSKDAVAHVPWGDSPWRISYGAFYYTINEEYCTKTAWGDVIERGRDGCPGPRYDYDKDGLNDIHRDLDTYPRYLERTRLGRTAHEYMSLSYCNTWWAWAWDHAAGDYKRIPRRPWGLL